MEVVLVQEHVHARDPVLLADITTADAVAQGHTVLARVHAPTVAANHLDDISPHPFSPTSSPSPATMAIATPSPVDVTATVVEALGTRGSAHALGHDPVLRLKLTGSGTERENGRETETAAPLTCPQRNTSMSEAVVTEETGGRGLGPTTGTEREIAATRANTTAVVDTQDMAVTGAETNQ